MSTSNQPSNDELFVARALEASINIALVGLILFSIQNLVLWARSEITGYAFKIIQSVK
jgi:hypothetical protein